MPYGAPYAGNAAYREGPGFAGHVTDTQTNLTYMQQRYYDPVALRFLSPDPVDVGSTNGSNFNRYWYANNNPYRFVDPDGRVSDEPARQARTSFSSMTSRPSIASRVQGGPANASEQNNSTGQSATNGASSSSGQSVTSSAKTFLDTNGAAAGVAQNRLVSNGSWRGANGKMYDLRWGGNQHTGARRLVLQEANVYRAAGQGMFLVSSGLSIYEGAEAVQNGDGFGVVRAGVDIGWGAAATFGGPVGLAGGIAYTGTSILVTIPSVHRYTVGPVTDAMCWAGGSC